MNHRRDIIAGAVLLALAVAYFALSFNIPIFKGIGSTPLTARFMPKFWGTCLILLSSLLLLRGLRGRKATVAAERSDVRTASFKEFWHKNYAVVLTFALLGAYIALLEDVGFIIMSALFMFIEMLVLATPGKRTYLFPAVLSVTLAVGLDYAFVTLLHVMLPAGIMGF